MFIFSDPSNQSMQDSPYVSRVSSGLSSDSMLSEEGDFKEDFIGNLSNMQLEGVLRRISKVI